MLNTPQVTIRHSFLLSLWVTGFLVTAAGHAQEEPESSNGPTPTAKDTASTTLPKNWLGTWKGKIFAESSRGPANELQLTLTIEPIESSTTMRFVMDYDGPQGASHRDYRLEPTSTPNRFIIDEQNGIRLDADLIGQSLVSHFQVAEQHIWISHDLVTSPGLPDRMAFSLTASSSTEPNRSEASGIQATSYRVLSRQNGMLERVAATPPTIEEVVVPSWRKLDTEAYRGKQDDIYFVDATTGWYVNGEGKIYKTVDGGESWNLQWHHPGTYFRCIAFVDAQRGFAGNIGPGYFPNVTDSVPLYETSDGGATWKPVTSIEGEPIVGLCSLQVLREPFVNAGKLDTRTRLIGVGRVGGPVAMIISDDLGATWQHVEVPSPASMAFDVHFFNRNEGILATASDVDVAQSNALIMITRDGGKTWKTAWQSSRPFELTWKISFPSREVGYVTIQSYNPDSKAKERYVAKTTDGGETWAELPLTDDARVREFGVAFLTNEIGWVGAVPHGFQTIDGGKTWTKCEMGNAVNKIRILPSEQGHVGFAIGSQVHRIDLPVALAP